MLTQSQRFSLILSFALLIPSSLHASSVYTVDINTSTLTGTQGYLDLQLEPGPSPSNLATAAVTNFTTDGTLLGAAALTGDASGQLPGTLSFDNATVFNDYFQNLTFGTDISFQVTLNGPTPIGGAASAFNIALYASDGATPLLTVSPDGIIGQLVLNPDGTVTPTTFDSGPSTGPAVTLATASSSTPEPTTFGLLGIALAAVSTIRSRRRP